MKYKGLLLDVENSIVKEIEIENYADASSILNCSRLDEYHLETITGKYCTILSKEEQYIFYRSDFDFKPISVMSLSDRLFWIEGNCIILGANYEDDIVSLTIEECNDIIFNDMLTVGDVLYHKDKPILLTV